MKKGRSGRRWTLEYWPSPPSWSEQQHGHRPDDDQFRQIGVEHDTLYRLDCISSGVALVLQIVRPFSSTSVIVRQAIRVKSDSPKWGTLLVY